MPNEMGEIYNSEYEETTKSTCQVMNFPDQKIPDKSSLLERNSGILRLNISLFESLLPRLTWVTSVIYFKLHDLLMFLEHHERG